MTKKPGYINILNEFWEANIQDPLSPSVGMLYLYLLNRINWNRWQPVMISDKEIARQVGISRRRLSGYKAELEAKGMIAITPNGFGCKGGSYYAIPPESEPTGTLQEIESEPTGAHICANRRTLRPTNGANGRTFKNQSEPTGAHICANRRTLRPTTPIYNNLKTYKDNYLQQQGAQARVDVGVEVGKKEKDEKRIEEIEAVEAEEAATTGAPSSSGHRRVAGGKKGGPAAAVEELTGADLLIAAGRRAEEQGAQLLAAFFDPSRAEKTDVQCMQLGINRDEYRALAEAVIADWAEAGTTHDDAAGRFDYRGAARHLQNTIRKKAAARAAAPKTRDQKRAELIAAATAGLNRAISTPPPDERNEGGSSPPFYPF